jgi:hypothetical protein
VPELSPSVELALALVVVAIVTMLPRAIRRRGRSGGDGGAYLGDSGGHRASDHGDGGGDFGDGGGGDGGGGD